jgi:hypothetical protein
MKYYTLLLLALTFGTARAQQADERAIVALIFQQNHDTASYYSSKSSMDEWSARYCDSVIHGGQNVISLSSEDKTELSAKLKAAKNLSAWPSGYFKRMVPADTIKKIFSDTSLGWRYFKQKYAGKIFVISKPVFIHNHSICVITYCMSANYSNYNNKQEVEGEKRFGEGGSYAYEIRVYVRQSWGEWLFKGMLLKMIT